MAKPPNTLSKYLPIHRTFVCFIYRQEWFNNECITESNLAYVNPTPEKQHYVRSENTL